jgi:hypothetical protein
MNRTWAAAGAVGLVVGGVIKGTVFRLSVVPEW